MNIKRFFIILVLSVVVTYGVSFIDSLINHTLLAGQSGFPLKYSSATLFGNGEINYVFMFLDIAFWFVALLIIWKVLQKVMGK